MHPSHIINISIDGNGLCHSVRVVCCWWCMCSGTSHITIGCIAHVWYIVALHTCISPYTHITHDMSATHIIIMWWVDCGTPVTSYTHTLYQSPHPIWHMQGTHHEWHVHTHTPVRWCITCMCHDTWSGIHTCNSDLCPVCVHNVEVHTQVDHIVTHSQHAIPHNWWHNV